MIESVRCYRCWKLLDNHGQQDHLRCPERETELFAGSLAQEVLKGNAVGTAEYPMLLGGLLKVMVQNEELYKGKAELIAGSDAWHFPDALYYRRGDMLMRQPEICEIETSQTLMEPNTLSKCRLFAQTAKNLSSVFYLIVPAACEGRDITETAENLLKSHNINPVEIMAL